MLFLGLFEPDQSEIKKIVQEIVNIHNGAIFKTEHCVSEQIYFMEKLKVIKIEQVQHYFFFVFYLFLQFNLS